jgi:hypothetical protein
MVPLEALAAVLMETQAMLALVLRAKVMLGV